MFSDNHVAQLVWQKAQYASDDNERRGFRKDACGAWMHRDAYGDRNSPWGWEIDHIRPVSKGGGDEISNLRPLHWRNNAAKAEGRLECVITSYGERNSDAPLIGATSLS